jgi:hypothetical protein
MAHRKILIMSLSALFAVAAIDPRPARPPRPEVQPTAEQIEAAVAYADLQAKLAVEAR